MNMLKQIQLKISKIKYTGDSVGDDIRIEVECLDKFVGFNKKLKCGSEREVGDDVGTFFADGASFTLPVNIKIIERDLIFNDVGDKKVNLKVDLKSDSPQSSVCKIEVQELRNFISKKKAVFEVTLEALVSETYFYISLEKTDDGWIWGRREDTKEKIDLVSFLKVKFLESTSERQYFEIMEGALQSAKASVIFAEDGSSYLQSKNPHIAPIYLTYSISKKTLKFKNKVYRTIDYPESPWEKGFYDIEIPDVSHRVRKEYLELAKLAKVWFLIGHDGERYLHVGRISAGCMTLTELERWDELCKILLKARKGDNKSIGALEVID